MLRNSFITRNIVATVLAWSLVLPAVSFAGPVTPAEQKPATPPPDAVTRSATPGVVGQLIVTVGKSLIIDSPLAIKRIATANGALVETTAISPKEILINGKAVGETTLTIWQQDDTRLIYDLTVRMSPQRLNAVREQIARDYPDANINVTFDNDTAFVRGTVRDTTMADRIMAIVGTMAKAVSLLSVEIPPVEPQIQLKVRFANVDRSASMQLGANFASSAFNMQTAIGTGSVISTSGSVASQVASVVNIFALRPDINLLAEIQALEGKNLLEILAEPNLMTFSGTRASFVAGGEFPYFVPQPSGTNVVFTIEFKEYGIRLNFLPRVTPQGTIHMQVNPEVSSLDYAHGVTFQGTTIPGTSVRRVSSEVDLESGQTFVIAGLLDREITESLSKVPGLGDIPILGKLFQSKTITKNNSELMIIITPEIVRPIPGNQPIPELKWTVPFMSNNSDFPMRQPGMDVTGQVPVHPPSQTLPLEQLLQQQRLVQQGPLTTAAPAAASPIAPSANPAGTAQPAAGAGAPPAGGGGGAGYVK